MTHRRSALTLVLFVTVAIFPRYEHVAAPAHDKPSLPDHTPLPGMKRVDLYGDPLPEGAVARLGTTRWRHDGEAWATAFSPNGKVLACAAFNGLIYLWDTATGREIRRLRMADNEQGRYTQSFIGFFPDGRILY